MAASTIDRRLNAAKKYIAKGDEFYEKAADEIVAAQKEDPTLSYPEIGRRVGKSRTWVRTLVQWRTSGMTSPTPHAREENAHQDITSTRRVARERPEEFARVAAKAMEDPHIAQAVAANSSPQALRNAEDASAIESYERRRDQARHARETEHVSPPDAASHMLGGVGPAELADKLHSETMEPRIDKVYFALEFAKTHWERHGFRLALTDVSEKGELDARMTEIGQLYAEMMNQYDAAWAAKLANEKEGTR